MLSVKTLRPPAQGGWTPVQLFSSSNSYLVEKIVGQGSFGTVAKCKRSSDKKTVAIKMIKDKADNSYQTRAEAKSLLRLSTLDSDKSNIVQWHSAFVDRGYFCLEFESLDRSLYDFMAQRKFQPLLLKEIRPIIQQLSNALLHLKALNMIHADLKLGNVMLVNHAHEPFKIKVIDFGLACNASSVRVGSCIQTRQYRSPEVMLGLPFTEAVDIWSVGCIAAYLYLGSLLYAGHSEYDIMRCIVETQGQLPDSLLSQGLKTHSFFNKVGKPPNEWKLKSPEEVLNSTGKPSVDIRAFKLKSLEEILTARQISSDNHADGFAELTDLKAFIEMLKGMLHLEGSMRLKPHQALNHPFIRMSHLRCKFTSTSYFQSSIDTMAVCRSKFSASVNARETRPVPQNQAAVGECPQPSLPGSANTVSKCLPALQPAAVPNNQDQQHSHPHPCTIIQSTSNVKSGIKRKADDGDLDLTETPRQSKLAKHEHSVHSCEEEVAVCPNNTSASVNAGGCPQPSLPGRANTVSKCLPALQPAAVTYNRDQQHSHPHPCTIIQSTSNVKSGIKRKADDGDLNLTESPRQSKLAKHEHSVHSCKEEVAVCPNNTSASVNAGGCPQPSLPGRANTVSKCLPALQPAAVPNNQDQQHSHPHPCTIIQSTSNVKSGIKRKADDGDLDLTETPRQSKLAKHEHSVHSCEEKVAVCPNNTSASVNAGGCPQPSLPGRANTVSKCLPALQPAAVPYNRDQQHSHPHPCTIIQSTSNVKSGIKRKADDGDLDLTETPRQSKLAKHEHSVHSCEEEVAVCPNNTSASVNAGGCPQQPRSASVYPVPQYLPAVGGLQQQPQSGPATLVQQYWPAVGQQCPYGATVLVQQCWLAAGDCPQHSLCGPTTPVQQYWPAVGQQSLCGPTTPVQQYWPAVGQQSLYGPTTPVQQYWPAVGQQSLYGPATPVQQYWPAVGQQSLYGPATPVQQYWPAVGQQSLYGATVLVQQYWPAVVGCPQQPQSRTATAVLHDWPAVGGFLQQGLYGTTVPVQQYTSSFAAVAYTLDQQHNNPHPHT